MSEEDDSDSGSDHLASSTGPASDGEEVVGEFAPLTPGFHSGSPVVEANQQELDDEEEQPISDGDFEEGTDQEGNEEEEEEEEEEEDEQVEETAGNQQTDELLTRQQIERDIFGDYDEDDEVPPTAGRREVEEEVQLEPDDEFTRKERISSSGVDREMVTAIFGDDDVSSSDENDGKAEKEDLVERKPVEQQELTEKPPVIEEDEPEEPEEAEHQRIEADMPYVECNLGDELYFVKMPNFLSVETRPFDRRTYEDELQEDDEILDEEGRRRLKLKVENTIRWRYARDEDGELIVDEAGNKSYESNARIVRWSDDSLSLHLGSEVFDMNPMHLTNDYSHLFIRQTAGLMGKAVFRSKLAFRPHSTESFTHKKMTLNMADRANKLAGVRVIPVPGHDPEKQRQKLQKEEEDKIKSETRRESQRRRMRDKSQHDQGISAAYLDDAVDEEGSASLSKLKRDYKTKRKTATKKSQPLLSSSELSSDSSESLSSDSESSEKAASSKRRRSSGGRSALQLLKKSGGKKSRRSVSLASESDV